MSSLNSTSSFEEDLALALQLNDLEHDNEDFLEYDDSLLDDDDDDDEYGDIRLAPKIKPTSHCKGIRSGPRRRNMKPASLQAEKKPAFTKIIQPIVDCSRPLTFPLEILGLVCAHLSQTSLRYCVSLVCKDWNRVSDKYIRRMGVWTPLADGHERQLLDQIKRLDTLECWFNLDPDVPDTGTGIITREGTHTAWRRFREAILERLEEQEYQQNPSAQEMDFQSENSKPLQQQQMQQELTNLTPKCLLHHIKHLSIRGSRLSYEDTILAMQYGLRFLNSLFLDVRQNSLKIPLFDLLNRCPSLRDFKVNATVYAMTSILSGDDEDLIPEPAESIVSPETAHFPAKPKVIIPFKKYPDQYPLRTFEVNKATIRQHVLERIIATCPSLRVFKVLELTTQFWIPQVGYRPYAIDEERLAKHAANCCPNLKWYAAVKRTAVVCEERQMSLMRKYFPSTKFLALTCCGHQPEMPSSLIAQTLLPQITVLEISLSLERTFYPALMNRVLCMTPNLLHLIAPKVDFSTWHLYRPSKPTPPMTKTFIENNRDRKRTEREEKRKHRQEARLRFQQSGTRANVTSSSVSVPAAADDNTDILTKVWKCRDLRTIDFNIRTGSLKAWCDYSVRYRLFRSLTFLKVSCYQLHVGQLQDYPHVLKQRAKDLEDSKALRKPGQAQLRAEEQLKKPLRFENDLLLLRGLRSLEFVQIEPQEIQGMIHPTDFEFLRRQSSETVLRYILNEDSNVNSVYRDKDEEDGGEGGNDSSADDVQAKSEYVKPFSREENDERYPRSEDPPKKGHETFWPHLEAFHIRYVRSPSLATNYSDIVEHMEDIRPGVEFSIKRRYMEL
ncbi:hypothetical protein BC939DRAFT_507432 [Gamsiella multidivaricata]|uniref:uncharacterized protein n=1 Tax=Gamsiella multidivaricata TaxID=101098 RepID=UPI0022205C78|nr:uncharacterized protein BC939DRAFT_507432 [Gamsiella multidivaricata]KAG0356730.1 hypothetical protein BGZ54_000624 [Gamsiella multidivaricata]KAI7817398.1 hypothetical protein BC939DRAFT_507432 [Gamsiella multidivaricata]